MSRPCNAIIVSVQGLKPVEIATGYEKALDVAVKALGDCVCETVTDVHNEVAVKRVVRASVMSKQLGNEDILADLATKACCECTVDCHSLTLPTVQVMPRNESGFNVDNVRICKIMGASIAQSTVMNGMVFKRNAEGEVRQVKDAKIAVFTCPFDITQTETKGTVLINTAAELKSFARGEETEIEKQIAAIVGAGVKVVVSGGKFGDLYLHHLNKHGVMAVRLTSKFDLRRLARSINATPLTTIVAPAAENIGHCDNVVVEEIGDTEVVVFRQSGEKGKVSTVVLRGASDNMLDDLQRAIDDAVNTVKALTKDGRCVAGAGAVEVEMARRVDEHGAKCPGIEQYPIQQFAMALESLPKQIIDNAGLKSSVILPKVVAAHAAGNKNACANLADVESPVADALQLGIVDLFALKSSALRLAVNAACTVLIIDQVSSRESHSHTLQIIMSKPAGGPKPKQGPKGMDADDPE